MGSALRTLAGLVLGLLAGGLLGAAGLAPPALVAGVELIGGLWLNALRMTVLPLVLALIVVGVAGALSAARASRAAARAMGVFVALLGLAGLLGVLAATVALELWPLSTSATSALRAGLPASAAAIPVQPPTAELLRGIIPANPFAAAAEGEILPFVVFALFLGFAVASLQPERRDALVGLFRDLATALLTIVGWVLWVAPVGVFALSFVLAVRADLAAAGALAHYVAFACAVALLGTLLAYVVAALFGRRRLCDFARAAAPAQAVAASTQSSLASLPAMLESARALRVPDGTASLILPLAVSVFRFTSPLVNVAVAVYAAHLYGVRLEAVPIAAAVGVAVLSNFSVVGVASQASFFVALVPVFAVLGVPLELLALLIAVESIPDIFRTLGNVSMDLAVTCALGRPDVDGARTPPLEAAAE